MEKHFGKCALCGNECELTFEHIPPRKAFNDEPVKPVTGDKMISDKDRMPWDISDLPYTNQQRGMGLFSLCQSCNNLTGTWYGQDYIKTARYAHCALTQSNNPSNTGFVIPEIHPLRLIKQILSMFCSINSGNDIFDPVRRFVLDNESSDLDQSRFKLYMYLTKSTFAKYAPLTVIMRFNKLPIESIFVSEITSYPLGFVLYIDSPQTLVSEGFEITSMCEWGYNDLADLHIPLCVKEMNDYFPILYRTQEEIRKCIEDNRQKRGHTN